MIYLYFCTFRYAKRMLFTSQSDADKAIIGLNMLWADLRNNFMGIVLVLLLVCDFAAVLVFAANFASTL